MTASRTSARRPRQRGSLRLGLAWISPVGHRSRLKEFHQDPEEDLLVEFVGVNTVAAEDVRLDPDRPHAPRTRACDQQSSRRPTAFAQPNKIIKRIKRIADRTHPAANSNPARRPSCPLRFGGRFALGPAWRDAKKRQGPLNFTVLTLRPDPVGSGPRL